MVLDTINRGKMLNSNKEEEHRDSMSEKQALKQINRQQTDQIRSPLMKAVQSVTGVRYLVHLHIPRR